MVNQAMEELFLEALARGHSITTASKLIGVDRSWHYQKSDSDPEWKKKADIWQQKSIDEALISFKSGFSEDWRAGEAYLKRKLKDEWGDTQKVEVSVEPGKDPLNGYTDEEITQLQQIERRKLEREQKDKRTS